MPSRAHGPFLISFFAPLMPALGGVAALTFSGFRFIRTATCRPSYNMRRMGCALPAPSQQKRQEPSHSLHRGTLVHKNHPLLLRPGRDVCVHGPALHHKTHTGVVTGGAQHANKLCASSRKQRDDNEVRPKTTTMTTTAKSQRTLTRVHRTPALHHGGVEAALLLVLTRVANLSSPAAAAHAHLAPAHDNGARCQGESFVSVEGTAECREQLVPSASLAHQAGSLLSPLKLCDTTRAAAAGAGR